MRILRRAALWLGNAHFNQQFNRPLVRGLPRERFLQFEHLRNLPPHRHQRVERRHRLLKDHGDVVAAQFFQLALDK